MKKGIKILLLADFFAVLATGMIGPIYAIFVQDIGGDILDASWAYFAYMISCGIVLYLMGIWENKVKNKGLFVVAGYALNALGCLSYFFVGNQFQLVITQIILGLSQAVLSPVFDSLYSDFVNRKNKAREWADWEAMLYVTNAIAAIVGGYFVASFGFKNLFLVMFVVALLATLASTGMLKGKKYLSES